MRIFLDANVVFSASNPGSGQQALVLRAAAEHTLVTSAYAWAEAERNLRLIRSGWGGGLDLLRPLLTVVDGGDAAVAVELPPKDRPILATAIRESCDLLVTGDRHHFGHLLGATVQGVEVITPLDLAQRLVQGG